MEEQKIKQLLEYLFILEYFQKEETFLTLFSSWSSIASLIISFANLLLIYNISTRVKEKKIMSFLISELKRYESLLSQADEIKGNQKKVLPTDIMIRINNCLKSITEQKYFCKWGKIKQEINRIKALNQSEQESLNKAKLSLNIILTHLEDVI